VVPGSAKAKRRNRTAHISAGTAPGEADPGGSQITDGPRLLVPRQAARVLGSSPDTLKRWRYEGVGPDYVVIMSRVKYDMAVLRRFVAENTRVPSVRAALEADRGNI
jgi:hypothetical protein